MNGGPETLLYYGIPVLYFQVQLNLPITYQGKYKWYIMKIDSGTQSEKCWWQALSTSLLGSEHNPSHTEWPDAGLLFLG